jgi:hypothetical protein
MWDVMRLVTFHAILISTSFTAKIALFLIMLAAVMLAAAIGKKRKNTTMKNMFTFHLKNKIR